MKTKVKNIYFCPFEYNALEEYLRSMAAKGWMIKKIKYLRHVLVFNRCMPQDVHFYVDVSVDFSILKEVDMPKRLEFRSFLEEYGYRFLFAYESLDFSSQSSNKTCLYGKIVQT